MIVEVAAPPSASMGRIDPRTPTPVAEEELIPGILFVMVFLHSLPSLAETVECWSLVSDGLLAVGQAEIVFTVKRESAEADLAYPRQLLQVYSMFHLLALRGRSVGVGGFTSIGAESGLLGRPDFRGIVYSTPQFLDGIYVAGPFLMAIILTGDEFQVAQDYGAVRATTILGRQYRFFPCAPWADRQRRSLASLKDMESSILGKVGTLRVPGPVVYLEGSTVSLEHLPMTHGLSNQTVHFTDQCVVLEVPTSARQRVEELLKGVPENIEISVLSNPDPLADAILYWSPGSNQPHSISAEGSRRQRIGGNFVLFVPDQSEDAVTVHEDGFVVKATAQTWKGVRASLAGGTSLRIPAKADGLRFEIRWHDTADSSEN